MPIPAGTYTLQEFCDRANALFTNYDAGDTSIGSICAITSFHAFVGGTLEEEKLEFRFKWKGADNDNGFAFHQLMGIDVSYGRYLARDIVGKASANVKPNAINGINSVIGGNAGMYTSIGDRVRARAPAQGPGARREEKKHATVDKFPRGGPPARPDPPRGAPGAPRAPGGP